MPELYTYSFVFPVSSTLLLIDHLVHLKPDPLIPDLLALYPRLVVPRPRSKLFSVFCNSESVLCFSGIKRQPLSSTLGARCLPSIHLPLNMDLSSSTSSTLSSSMIPARIRLESYKENPDGKCKFGSNMVSAITTFYTPRDNAAWVIFHTTIFTCNGEQKVVHQYAEKKLYDSLIEPDKLVIHKWRPIFKPQYGGPGLYYARLRIEVEEYRCGPDHELSSTGRPTVFGWLKSRPVGVICGS